MLKSMKKISDIYYDLSKNKFSKIYRSISGEGNKKLLKEIKKIFPKFKISYFISGQQVYDWRIPPEWNIKDAYILDKENKKILDFKKNFLHVVGYSCKVNKFLTKKNLLKKIHTLKNLPNAIPYVTAYYKKKFYGFCLSYSQLKKIKKKYNQNDKFKILIDSKFKKKNGKLHYGEIILKGKNKKEIFISTYICHPLMANNEHSGLIVSLSLIDYFIKKKLNYTLRFLFIPETIGSIAYINKNLKKMKKNIIGGFNISCVGDEGQHSYMLSKHKKSLSDIALQKAYKDLKINAKEHSFLERGSDERQYCSPGVDLPITSIFKTKYGEYKEYHTSLDDFNFVTKNGVYSSFKVAKKAIDILDNFILPKYVKTCEPNMGKRGLYPLVSSKKNKLTKRYMDFLMYADGKTSLNTIASIMKINIHKAKKLNKVLLKNNLITN